MNNNFINLIFWTRSIYIYKSYAILVDIKMLVYKEMIKQTFELQTTNL